MPDDFSQRRDTFAAARDKSESGRTAVIRAAETVKRLTREIDTLSRQARDEDDDAARARLAKLEEQRDRARAQAGALQRDLAGFEAAKLAALDEYSVFTNPIDGVNRLPDDTPIALFPLRLETRYRTIARADAAPRRVLCVRVFPDDVLVDTFQPEIAEAELTNVTNYWVHRWRAGGDVAGHRAAWAALVRSNGAGRAKWLTEQVAPTNPNDEPVALPGDHILVVTPALPLPDGEKIAIAAFWSRVWSTSGAERDAAFDDLKVVVGEARATQIEAELVPVNLRDGSVKPSPSTNPVVAFLDLPAPDTLPVSQDSWTRGARAWLLPERLVLLGFRGGQRVLQLVGQPIPPDLQIGPDPSAPANDQIRADGADLQLPAALRWTVDFEEAVAKGMGFVVNVDDNQELPRYDRLFVLGVRIGSDAAEGASELSELIEHHQGSRKGFALLPQGRPTNNTDASSAGYPWWEDPEDSFEQFFGTAAKDDPFAWERRTDGAWLAGMLGVKRALLRGSPNYYGTDQAEARAMNVALWPATLGYYMEQMMEPVFSEQTVRDTRAFFTRFVTGRGTIPLIRVGRQPYGILPATVWSRMAWWNDAPYARAARAAGLPDRGYLQGLFDLTQRAAGLWGELAADVANTSQPGDDPQQTLLSILALHPTSAEFYQRYARSFTHYYNILHFSHVHPGAAVSARTKNYVEAALLALEELGWKIPARAELPEILEKIFFRRANLLKGHLVQAELSDAAALAVTRADGLNYIAWLQSAARTSHDVLRRQEGFADGVPEALLYQMLRHALDLGFIEAALDFRRTSLQMSDTAYKAARKEPKYIHVAEQDGRSRWEDLYRPEPAVTGDPALRLGDYIPKVLTVRDPYLATQLAALDVLKTATSGALERAFVEHLDCLTYRLDAWRLGIHAVQLSQMRGEFEKGFAKGGIYIGAYGWLENVQPKPQTLEPVKLDAELAAIFNTAGAPPLVRDSTNFGHIHAPSLDHAVTAAILRNGHLANATPEAPELLAVDLTSERVRLAQQIIEGIRNGQSLGALLGYRLERALHDEPDLFLDRLIYDLRRAFPLAGNRNQRTKTAVQKITQVEARNVIDGAAFLDHLAENEVATYPYARTDLPPLSDFTGPGLPSAAQIGAIIDGHVAQMRSVADAVADLQIAEGVYQVVRGNYERASGTLDAYSKGSHPPLPEVVTTPHNGRTLTHRIGLHLEGGLAPADPANTTPRMQGEPALAQWLAGQLPDPATIFARVTWRDETNDVDVSLTPNMDQLGLAPVDLFYLIDAGGARDMPGFDDLLIDFAERNGAPPPRHDAIFTLEYKPAGVAGLTLFELAPLVRALRGLLLGTRSLRASDLALPNEARSGEDSGVIVRADKVQAVIAGLQGTLGAINAFIAALEASIGDAIDPAVARDAARDNIDQWMRDYAAIVRPVVPFGLQAASLTAGVEGRRAPFTALRAALFEIRVRWEEKADDFDDAMAAYAALPGTATDEERIALLVRAGRIVSTTVLAPLPALIADLEAAIAGMRATFDTESGNLTALHDGAMNVGATLAALLAFVPSFEAVDQTPLDLTPFHDSLLALAKELQQKAAFLRDDIGRRIADATAALNRAAAAIDDKAQAAAADAAKAILGDAFMLLPEFTLSAARLAEWDNAWSNRAGLLAHLASPFPLDDWLHGVARVRERVRFLESVILLGEALGAANAPSLDAVQFPFKPDDAWLGLEFPATFPNGDPFAVEEDKLLYSPHFGPGADIDPTDVTITYSGLLIDEWVEVVPIDEVTTGLAFHFDRPNSEAPQAILLATPPAYQGSWQWQNLVDTLHETLDFARLRAVEPAQLDRTALGPLLPAVISPVTTYPITAALNFSVNNGVTRTLAEGGK